MSGVVADNIRAVGALHFSAMLEAMRAYDVVDRLVALASQGRLPLHRPDSADRLGRYIRSASERLTVEERRGFYARGLGVPAGTVDGEPNREFDALWRRFVTSVSELARQQAPDAPPPPPPPPQPSEPPVGQERVRLGAKALAVNLSTHGKGLSAVARTLTSEVSQLIEILRIQEFSDAFAVRDIWRLVERVSSQELGASPGVVVQRRTMAEQGTRIFAWLATRPPRFWTSGGDALDMAVVTSQRRSTHPASTPTDYDLVEACEQWLAVTARDLESDRGTRPGQPLDMTPNHG